MKFICLFWWHRGNNAQYKIQGLTKWRKFPRESRSVIYGPKDKLR